MTWVLCREPRYPLSPVQQHPAVDPSISQEVKSSITRETHYIRSSSLADIDIVSFHVDSVFRKPRPPAASRLYHKISMSTMESPPRSPSPDDDDFESGLLYFSMKTLRRDAQLTQHKAHKRLRLDQGIPWDPASPHAHSATRREGSSDLHQEVPSRVPLWDEDAEQLEKRPRPLGASPTPSIKQEVVALRSMVFHGDNNLISAKDSNGKHIYTSTLHFENRHSLVRVANRLGCSLFKKAGYMYAAPTSARRIIPELQVGHFCNREASRAYELEMLYAMSQQQAEKDDTLKMKLQPNYIDNRDICAPSAWNNASKDLHRSTVVLNYILHNPQQQRNLALRAIYLPQTEEVLGAIEEYATPDMTISTSTHRNTLHSHFLSAIEEPGASTLTPDFQFSDTSTPTPGHFPGPRDYERGTFFISPSKHDVLNEHQDMTRVPFRRDVPIHFFEINSDFTDSEMEMCKCKLCGYTFAHISTTNHMQHPAW